tara:strand:- start:582 stop:1394 length:813 start_codon:yes stop_codon:yes gene_type:complete
MQQKTKDIQNHFEGFLKTPCLWIESAVYGLKQFEIDQKSISLNKEIDDILRLGKYIERFVSYELSQNEQIEIISENIQIQKEKITIGELDCILLKDKKPIHLEIIYKFYLYDVSVGTDEIAHFIGPNRKDSLVSKLVKLKEKQLPLLYSIECKNYLKKNDLNFDDIEQQVYFKAQLFVPFTNKNIELKQLNSECIAGFYINFEALNQFKDCSFYIPKKKDWLVVPHTNVAWQSMPSFKEDCSPIIERNFSPMCWMKHKNGCIEKFFLVWW